MLDGQTVDGAEERQVRLPLAVDDLEGEPELPGGPIHQLVGVLGLPDRRGGHGDRLFGARSASHHREVAEGLEGPFDGRLAEPAAPRQVAGKSKGDPGVGEDLEMSLPHQPEHHGPAGVRSDVDDGDAAPSRQDLHVNPRTGSRDRER